MFLFADRCRLCLGVIFDCVPDVCAARLSWRVCCTCARAIKLDKVVLLVSSGLSFAIPISSTAWSGTLRPTLDPFLLHAAQFPPRLLVASQPLLQLAGLAHRPWRRLFAAEIRAASRIVASRWARFRSLISSCWALS
jgi:hypothetical protein